MASKTDLLDPYWRLNNLYWIKNKQGEKVKFKFNWAQEILYKNMWFLCLILKVRQIGITTFIQIFMLDRCLFNSNTSAGVIAHTKEDAQKFFKNKIKFAYDNLPESLKRTIQARNDSAGELVFSNGSEIRVGVSLRSGTFQYLHVSEYGPLGALSQEKAEEIKTGALNTVAQGSFVFIESTSVGDYGEFYDMCMEYKDRPNLTAMDYKLFFFPWYKHPEYQMDEEVSISSELESYFSKLESENDIVLSAGQKAWYSKKRETQKSKMQQEFPSTIDEAFEQVSEFSVYGAEIGKIIEEKRLCSLPINHGEPVHLFFDIGKSTKAQTTSVWFMQDNDPWYDFVDYYQSSLQPVSEYVRDIKEKGYNLGKWHIPHDAGDQKDYDIKTFEDRLVNAGVSRSDIVVVPRVDTIKTGIDMTREKMPACRFDKDRTQEGWRALKAYRYAWNERRSVLSDPIHDWASHPSDALRQFGQAWTHRQKYEKKISERRQRAISANKPSRNWIV